VAGYAMDRCATVRWITRPSAAPRDAISGRLLLAVLVVSILIATGFSLAGAWPVLPFAGVEVAALWLALRHLRCHARDYERIVREGDRLFVERQIGSRLETIDLHPYWARLRLEAPPGGGEGRLLIGSHGREVEIGRGLAEKNKRALSAEIRKALAL